MGYIFRKIRKAKWYHNPAVQWLDDGEIQADALFDLKTNHNCLSFWLVDQERKNLNKIIATNATANTDSIKVVDYVLLDSEILEDLNISSAKTDGLSPHSQANAEWHINLINLTSKKVCMLAEKIMLYGIIERVLPGVVTTLVTDEISNGSIDKNQMKESLREEIDKGK